MTKTLHGRSASGSTSTRSARAFVFAGDSPNDAPMFAYFPNAVGVANVRASAHRIAKPPAYVTAAASGAGFVELAERLLALRHG